MFRRTKVCSGVLVALGGALSLGSAPVFGQQTFERVEITGSSVRRVDAEGALPVTVLKKEDIARTGATSVVDLLQKLPTVQGGTAEASSVGGGSFGFSGVSIHNIGETRTLVLLNGHRLSQFGGQALTGFGAGVDLNSIPISAIERVEILTDGASALYGADAIAGVVNFITKRDSTEGDVTIGLSYPQHNGAEEKRFSISKGFGSLDKDGWNIFASYGHDERKKLDSADRDYASTGRVFFNKGGTNYRFQQYSSQPIPANVINDNGNLVNPYLITTGECAPNSFRVTDGADDFCGFDFVSTLEIYPIRERDSFFGSGNFKLGDHVLFADVLWSKTKQISRIAPVPGPIDIAAGTPLHNQYLLPLGITQDTTAFYRIADMGKRENEDTAEFWDVALGSKGSFMNWDYAATYTHSQSDVKGNIAGYPGALAIANLTRPGGPLDPFVLPGQQSQAGIDALAAANYKGYFDGGVAKLDTLQVRGSRDLMKMEGGNLQLGLGANFNKEKFTSKPSPFAQGILSDPVAGTLCDPVNAPDTCDQRFGDASASPPYSAKRDSWGLFGELVIPVMKDLELGAAIRYDHYSDFGGTTNGKATFRWNPMRNLLVRGSVGTGFHAPTVPQINAAVQSFGVTSGNYDCSAELLQIATSLGAECRPPGFQYDQFAGGNQDLKPEKSKQFTFGLRYEPTAEYSLGADFWWVGIKDSFGQITEQEAFANPLQYSSAWTTARDVGTGTTYVAFLANNQNLGKSYTSGIDFDLQGRWRTSFGQINSQILATYMIREQQQLQAGGEYFTAIGNYAELGVVTFRWQGRWTTSLVMDKWTHTLGFNYKSSFRDQEQTVEVLDDAGNVTGTEDIRLKVKDYYTFDIQSKWMPIKQVELSLGILNLFDKDPPFTISNSGTSRGQQFGYDTRYYDPRGRTFYGNASYKF